MTIAYKLYYWPLPFRGAFVQLLLEHAGAEYQIASSEETLAFKDSSAKTQGIPAMAPPFLKDCINGTFIAQMPAIMMYMSERLGYLPSGPYKRALVLKTLLDCNDVLSDLTNANGSKMWEHEQWISFRTDRLKKWMRIFEATGERNGLRRDAGFLLNPDQENCADIAITALFGTMCRCLPQLHTDFKVTAPKISALVARIESDPIVRDFIERQEAEHGQLYCGGQIEQSIRDMLAQDEALSSKH
ncbi:MAG: hypothetical protein WBM41_09920 [Arenicellales bacterium]